MARYRIIPDTITVTNNNGATGYYSLVNSGVTVRGSLDPSGIGNINLIAPYNSNSSATVDFTFSASDGPSINAMRKQAAVRRVCTMTSGDPNLPTSGGPYLRFRPGASNLVSDPRIYQYSYPKTFGFHYPINGSNGGTNYWDGNNANLKFVIPGLRGTSAGLDANITISTLYFEWGEADDYMDVDCDTFANRDAGLGGIAWSNIANAGSPDTNGASYQQASASYSLDRRKASAFTLPAGTTYQGMEVWDGMTMGNSLGRVIMGLAHWPLSSPASATPTYQFDQDFGVTDQLTLNNGPPVSVTPAGAGSKTANSYMVWGGGPGDTFQDSNYAQIQNSWPGLTESRLLSGGYAPTVIVSMTSATNAYLANRVFFRVFYDNPPVVDAPLLLCEA